MDWGRLARFARFAYAEFLDAILPPRAHTRRTKGRRLADIPLLVRNYELLDAKITTLMDYQKAEVRDLIRSLKYDGNERAARLCASVLADYLREEIASIHLFSPRPVFLIPLPLHESRERERGFNQIAIVLDQLPEEFRDGRLTTRGPDILRRARATVPQTHLSRRERLRNVNGAFRIDWPEYLQHAHVFIIDDVTTTGATLQSAAKPFLKANAEVTLIALARA